MWTRIDLPRAKVFERREPDGTRRQLQFNAYDFSVQPADRESHRFLLTVRLKIDEVDAPPQMRWSEAYEDEQAAYFSIVRIIGAMPEAEQRRR